MANTPHLPTRRFTERESSACAKLYALCMDFWPPDFLVTCDTVIQSVKEGAVPSGTTAERHW